MKLFSVAMVLLAISSNSWGKLFQSKYCEFELPPGWECALEGSEYVCQSENVDRKKESIIILAAKIRGEQDTLDQYMSYLKQTKEYTIPGGKKQISEAKNTKLTKINEQQWVDALHLASEVPGFYTRYLATVKEDLGIAVTFSVTKDQYSAYLPMMDKMIASLKVFRQKKADIADLRNGKKADENFEDATFNPNVGVDLQVNKTKKRAEGGGEDEDLIYLLAVLLIGGIVFVIMKNKKKDNKDKKKQK